MFARRDWLWLGLLSLAAAALPEHAAAVLEYRRAAILDGELWRLLSGHFVYFSTRHALLDGCALVTLAYALGGGVLPRLVPIGLALSGVLMLVTPEMSVYRGASGLVMALAGMLLSDLWRTLPGWRPALVAVGALLTGKMLADAMGLTAGLAGLPEGIHVAWQAHAGGLVLGILAGRINGREAA